MSAQINLVQGGGVQSRRDYLTLTQVVVAAAILYLSLFAIGGWSWWQAVERQKETAVLAEEARKVKVQVDELTQKAAKANPQILADIEQIQAQVRRRDDIARLLESKASGAKEGFSEHLQGLARQIPEGLWLTAITINDGGRDLEIRGSLIDTAALPEYIHRLGNEPVFRGRNFSTLSLNRVSGLAAKPAAAPVLPLNLAVQQGAATPELQERLTARTGAFVGVAPSRTSAGELANVIDFVLVPQRSGNREAKP